MNSKAPPSSHRFFSNSACRFFPCHPTDTPECFNCLFCYCPLYAMGDACGGRFTRTDAGVKDCSACTLPHTPEGYDYILSRLKEAGG